MKKQSKTVEIIFLQKKSNAKSRDYERFGEILKRKDAEREFNQKLKKAFWRHENPRQQLRDFQRQIVVYATLFMNHRKKQQKQKIIEQKAHIDVLFLN
ncbi:hypothetical protein [Arsenophonus sp. PmNCSU2021_1]|uniref:hypothetical protein n=1 Tax=Arsenophonus sp. PmNCSU2021_1 TaxID=3118989 RepID=UPI002FF39EF3